MAPIRSLAERFFDLDVARLVDDADAASEGRESIFAHHHGLPGLGLQVLEARPVAVDDQLTFRLARCSRHIEDVAVGSRTDEELLRRGRVETTEASD